MAWDMKRYENVLRKQTGKAIRPSRFDGYANLINRYGTAKDDTEQYFYKPEPPIDDIVLEMFYENNGLFARIIDTPAEEAVKHGFTLEGIEDDELTDFYQSAIDELDWEDVAMTGIKWARLFGGSIAIMLINDGHGLEEPVDWKHIRSIDDIVVYDRSMIVPDRSSMYGYGDNDPFRTRGSRLGTPEWYDVSAPSGVFRVHDSRCLVFRNGVLPLNALNEIYQFWGIPEYVRINRAVRNAEIAHESAPKMLSKSVQPIYKMKDLAMELATEEGEDKVLRRLQIIDMARGLLNSIAIDSEGEDYSFQSFGFTGVSDVIESSCNWLSALTNIPQTILFGRSPAGMNATGESDFENYYNYVERIQKRMLRANLRYLLSIIFTAGYHTKEIKNVPDSVNVQFNPLWSMSEVEEVQLESSKLQNELTRANIAQTYISNEVLDPKEVRVELGKEDPMDPETMLDDMSEEELMETAPQGQQGAEGGMGGMMGGGMPPMAQGGPNEAQQSSPENYAEQGNSPETAPEATKLPQDMNPEDEPDHEDAEGEDLDWITANGTHIPLNDEGKAVGGPLAGKDFSKAKTEPSANQKESAFTPKRSDYVTEYEDEYSGKISLEDAPPEDRFTYWKEMNMDKLKELYKQERAEAKAHGEPIPSANELCMREWYRFQTNKVNNDIQYMNDEESDEVLSKYISPSTFEGWFRAYDSNYKPRVVNGLIASQEARNAALSIMYDNYKYYNDGDLSFEDFLITPVKVYRGGHGQKHIEDDVFSSYTFNKKVAEGFAGNDGRVYEAEIRPIDTWGSVTTNGESEIMVPSWIAPNGNVDSADYEEDDSQDPGGLIKSWGKPEYEPPLPIPDIDKAKGWLVRDFDSLMSYVPDGGVEAPEWLDDEIMRRIRSVGVIVVDGNGKILSGIRKGGDGKDFDLLGGPGGHVEPHESLEDAAIRETYEEFGIIAKDLMFLSLGEYEEESGMIPAIFLCTEWSGNMHPIDGEMENIRFRTIDDILSHNIFKPFENSLNILQMVLTNAEEDGIIDVEEGESNRDDRFDGNPAFARAIIGKAKSEGFEYPADSKETLDKAIEFLKKKGISTSDVFDDYNKNVEHQKKRGSEKKKAQDKFEENAEKGLSESEKAEVDKAKGRAKKLLPLFKNRYSDKWNEAQKTHAYVPKNEAKERIRGQIKLSKVRGSTFPELDSHYEDHVVKKGEKTFAGMTKEQYHEFANNLAQSKPGKNIKGMLRNNGDIYRYDAEKNVLVIVDGVKKTVKSCHELNEEKYTNLLKGGIKGRAYFEFMNQVFRWK